MNPETKAPSTGDIYGGGRKRIFIGLLSATCLAICLCLFLLLILPWLGQNPGFLRYASIAGGGAGICFLAWLCFSLVFNIYTGRPLPGICGARHILVRILLPLMEIVGKLFGVDRQIVRRSFIKVNNELVISNFKPVEPHKLLLLLPHCIQASICPKRLTYSLENCRHCGRCQIGELIDLAAANGFHLAVATGGTIARRIVVKCRPKCIVAVACERDLTSGIQDSYPIPVFGVLNERPSGPCMDTAVPLPELLNALEIFLGKDVFKDVKGSRPGA